MGKERNLLIGLAAGGALIYILKPEAVKDAIGGAMPGFTNIDLSNLLGGLKGVSEGAGEMFDPTGLFSDSPFAGWTLPDWWNNPPPGDGGDGGDGGDSGGGEPNIPLATPNIWEWFTGLPEWAQIGGVGSIGAAILATLGLGGYAGAKAIPLIKPAGELALRTVRPITTAASTTAGRWITNLGRGKFPWAGGQRGFIGTGTLGSLALVLGIPLTAMAVLDEVMPRIDPRFGAWNYNPFSSEFWTYPFSPAMWSGGIKGFNVETSLAIAEAESGQPEQPVVVTSERGFTAGQIGETLPQTAGPAGDWFAPAPAPVVAPNRGASVMGDW